MAVNGLSLAVQTTSEGYRLQKIQIHTSEEAQPVITQNGGCQSKVVGMGRAVSERCQRLYAGKLMDKDVLNTLQ